MLQPFRSPYAGSEARTPRQQVEVIDAVMVPSSEMASGVGWLSLHSDCVDRSERFGPKRRGETALEYFAAMSLERSSVCVVDGTGKIIRETKVEREPEALVPEEPVQVPGGFSRRSYRRRFGLRGIQLSPRLPRRFITPARSDRKMRGFLPFLKDAWRLALPYFRSEERWSARGLLGIIIVMNLALVGMDVVLDLLESRVFQCAAEQGLGRLHPTALFLPSHRQWVDARFR